MGPGCEIGVGGGLARAPISTARLDFFLKDVGTEFMLGFHSVAQPAWKEGLGKDLAVWKLAGSLAKGFSCYC